MARSGNCWKRLAAIPPKAKKAAQTCQITQLGSRWSRVTPPRLRREAKTSTLSGVGPAVRIPSPPAASPVRTALRWRAIGEALRGELADPKIKEHRGRVEFYFSRHPPYQRLYARAIGCGGG